MRGVLHVAQFKIRTVLQDRVAALCWSRTVWRVREVPGSTEPNSSAAGCVRLHQPARRCHGLSCAPTCPVLLAARHADDQLELLNRLIAGGEGLGLHLEQVDILKANVEVSEDVVRGGTRLAHFSIDLPPPTESAALLPVVSHPICTLLRLALPSPAELNCLTCGSPSQPPPLAQALLWARKVRALFGRLHLPEDEPALAQQAQQGGDAEDAEVADVLRRSVDLVSLAAGGQPFDERPPLSEAVALLEEGYILPCDEALYKRLNE